MTTPNVDCPGCGRSQPRRTEDAIYWCDVCQCQFDADSDEGGDYCTDPTKRLEREERREEFRKQRKEQRKGRP